MSVLGYLELVKETKRRKLHVTNIEQAAWKMSDNLEKTIHYLSQTDLTEKVRRKMIRDMIKDNLIRFYLNQSNTKLSEERK